MKKALKISSYLLIIACAISLALCFIIIPERTRYAMDIVIEWLNKPLGIVCGTTITLGLVVTIIVKLVYDRHKEKLASEYEKTIAVVKQKEDKAKEYYELGKQKEEQALQMLDSYSTRIDTLENELVKVCETMPNAKIKALGEEIKSKGVELKQELVETLKDNDFVNAIKERISTETLLDKLNELADKVNALESKYEREETTND